MKRISLFIVCLIAASFLFHEIVSAGMLGGRSRQSAVPDVPTGATLWEQLKKMNYTKTMKIWPGKTSLYEGTEPHGSFLTTYVNGPAFMGVAGKKGSLPAGSMIVKENYSPEKKLVAVTVMSKVPAYNPEGGDWFWARYAPDGKIEAEGKVEACINCHAAKKDNDFIMTGPLK